MVELRAMGGAVQTAVALAALAAVAVEVGSASHTIDDSYGPHLQAGQIGWIRTHTPRESFGNVRSGQ